MTVEEPAVLNETAAPSREGRKPLLPRPLLIGALLALIPLAVYLWSRPLLQENQLRRASLPELQEKAKRQATPRTLYYLSLRLREKGDVRAAYDALKQAAPLAPSDADIWLALADTARTVEGDPAAFNVLTAFVKVNPQNAPGHLGLARLYLERRSYRRAREEARLAAAADSRLAEAWRVAGQSALAMELPGDAEPDLRRALALAPNDWQSQTALGDAIAAQNRFADSIPVYQEAARLAPNEPVPALSLGRALFKAAPANAMPEQLEPARQSIERSISLRGDIPIAYVLLGQCLARQKRLPEAQAALEKARDLAPADPDAYFELSRVAALRGDHAASAAFRAQHGQVLQRRNAFGDRKRTLIAKIDNAVSAGQQETVDSLRRELARFLAEGGEPSEALQQYGLLLTRRPDDAGLQREAAALQLRMQQSALARMTPAELLTTGDDLFRQKRYIEAADVYRNALSRDAKDSRAAEGLGLSLDAAGRGEEATYYLLAATRLNAHLPRAEFALGLRYRDIGFLTEANKRLHRVVELEPKNAAAWHSLGEILRDRDGSEVEAESAFQRTAELEPGSTPYLLDYADMLDTNHKKPEAEATFRKALTLAPDSAEASASFAAFLINNGVDAARSDEAEKLLNRALTLDPADDYARYYQGKLALARGNAARAATLLEAVLKNGDRSDDSREIWYTLARAYTKKGDRKNADRALAVSHKLETESVAYVQAREQVSLHPNDPERHRTLARAYARRGEFARAITEYQRCLQLSPKNAAAQQELTALTTRLQAEGQMPSMSAYQALTTAPVR